MIALDLDGTIINYGGGVPYFNMDLLPLLPRQRQNVAIVTNQGGIPFSYASDKFPSPYVVMSRLNYAMQWMHRQGYPVVAVYACVYHPRCSQEFIEKAAAELRQCLAPLVSTWHVYATERARKPHPLMLRAAGATVYYGDSPEDGQAASAAGVPFVEVPRFL